MYDVTGKSIRDIMNIAEGDFLSFTEREQKAITSRLVSAANKRVRRFVKSIGEVNLKSYTSEGKFSVKGKTKKSGELAHEFKRVKEFLSRKTSSVRGYKDFKKKLEEESKYVGSRKDLEEQDLTDYDIDFETGEIIEPYKSEEDFEDFELSTGDVWQAVDDTLEDSRSELEKGIVYEIHDLVQDYMSERRKKKYSELNSNQKADLKEIIDRYIQDNSTFYGTFSGNM